MHNQIYSYHARANHDLPVYCASIRWLNRQEQGAAQENKQRHTTSVCRSVVMWLTSHFAMYPTFFVPLNFLTPQQLTTGQYLNKPHLTLLFLLLPKTTAFHPWPSALCSISFAPSASTGSPRRWPSPSSSTLPPPLFAPAPPPVLRSFTLMVFSRRYFTLFFSVVLTVVLVFCQWKTKIRSND